MCILLLFGLTGLSYPYMSAFVTRELSLDLDEYQTKDSLRTPQGFQKIYRQLHVMHILNVEQFSAIPIPLFFWTYSTAISIVCYQCIRFTGVVVFSSMVLGFAMLGYLIFASRNMANVHTSSQAMLESWRAKQHCPYFRKVLKSCRPLKHKVGSWFCVDKGMIVTMMQSILD
ncbi:unnamed protein product, partial [Allacma fusca]